MVHLSSIKKTQKRVRKIKRKAIISLFSFVVIINVPILFSQYQLFDTFSKTRLAQVQLINNLSISLPDWVMQLNFFHVIMAFLLLIMALRIASVRRQNYTSERYQRRIKSVLDYVDMVQFSFMLVATYVVVNAFFFSFATIDGASMNPTLYDNDDVVLSHFNITYDYFDIIVVEVPIAGKDNPDFYIKRLIGFPYDTVLIEGGYVYLNQQRIEEPYLLEDTKTYCPDQAGSCEFELSEGEYFVMGDNRENSTDSRHLGPFPESQMYGVVTYRIRPFRSFGEVN